MTDESTIKARLEETLGWIFRSVPGSWPIHGGWSEYYFDPDADVYVLEIWPVGVEVPGDSQGHAGEDTSRTPELAEFDFTALARQVPLEYFHFSQRRSVFEIGWKEEGCNLELRVHLLPAEASEK